MNLEAGSGGFALTGSYEDSPQHGRKCAFCAPQLTSLNFRSLFVTQVCFMALTETTKYAKKSCIAAFKTWDCLKSSCQHYVIIDSAFCALYW